MTIDGRAHALACQTLCREGQVVRTARRGGRAMKTALRHRRRRRRSRRFERRACRGARGRARSRCSTTIRARAARSGAKVRATRRRRRCMRFLTRCSGQSSITHWPSTRVIAPLGPRGLLLESAEHGGACVSYDRLILATGARERLLPFAGWTLPGVTGAGASAGAHQRRHAGAWRADRDCRQRAFADRGARHRARGGRAGGGGGRAGFGVRRSRASASRCWRAPAKLRQAVGMTRGFAGLHYWTGSIVREAQGDGRVERVTDPARPRQQTTSRSTAIASRAAMDSCRTSRSLRRSAARSAKRARSSSTTSSARRSKACSRRANAPASAARNWPAWKARSPASRQAAAPQDACRRCDAQRARWRRFGRARRNSLRIAGRRAHAAAGCHAAVPLRRREHRRGARASPTGARPSCTPAAAWAPARDESAARRPALYFGWQAAAPRPPFSPAQIGDVDRSRAGVDGPPQLERGRPAVRARGFAVPLFAEPAAAASTPTPGQSPSVALSSGAATAPLQPAATSTGRRAPAYPAAPRSLYIIRTDQRTARRDPHDEHAGSSARTGRRNAVRHAVALQAARAGVRRDAGRRVLRQGRRGALRARQPHAGLALRLQGKGRAARQDRRGRVPAPLRAHLYGAGQGDHQRRQPDARSTRIASVSRPPAGLVSDLQAAAARSGGQGGRPCRHFPRSESGRKQPSRPTAGLPRSCSPSRKITCSR